MLNLHTKRILLSRDLTQINKTYGDYVSRKQHTKYDSYIPQDEYNYNNWDHVKNDPPKTKVKTEYVNNEHNVNTDQDSWGEEDVKYVYKTIKAIYLKKEVRNSSN